MHLPVHFRNELPMGSFPYPFWHSKSKWDAYQSTSEIVLVTNRERVSMRFEAVRSIQAGP